MSASQDSKGKMALRILVLSCMGFSSAGNANTNTAGQGKSTPKTSIQYGAASCEVVTPDEVEQHLAQAMQRALAKADELCKISFPGSRVLPVHAADSSERVCEIISELEASEAEIGIRYLVNVSYRVTVRSYCN